MTVVTFATGLGDNLLLVPALRALERRFPDARIHVCGSPEAGPVLMAAGVITSYSDVDDPRLSPLVTGKFTASLFDALSRPSLVVVYISRQERSAAALKRLRIPFVVDTPRPYGGEHAAEHFLLALEPLGIDEGWSEPESVSPLTIRWDKLAALAGRDEPGATDGPAALVTGADEPRATVLAVPKGRVVIHPGSGGSWKCAPVRLFQEIGDALQNEGYTATLLQGPADEDIVSSMKWRRDILRPASVVELAHELASSAAFIGNDSGISHLAGLLGLPTIALFGPTHPDTWRPMGPHVRVIRECSQPPSSNLRVCYDPRCLDSIDASAVMSALSEAVRAREHSVARLS